MVPVCWRAMCAQPQSGGLRGAAQEIPELNGVPSYWVNSAACIDVARNAITHKTAAGELVETGPWLREGPLSVGVTSGASTVRPRLPRPAPRRRPRSARCASPLSRLAQPQCVLGGLISLPGAAQCPRCLCTRATAPPGLTEQSTLATACNAAVLGKSMYVEPLKQVGRARAAGPRGGGRAGAHLSHQGPRIQGRGAAGAGGRHGARAARGRRGHRALGGGRGGNDCEDIGGHHCCCLCLVPPLRAVRHPVAEAAARGR